MPMSTRTFATQNWQQTLNNKDSWKTLASRDRLCGRQLDISLNPPKTTCPTSGYDHVEGPLLGSQSIEMTFSPSPPFKQPVNCHDAFNWLGTTLTILSVCCSYYFHSVWGMTVFSWYSLCPGWLAKYRWLTKGQITHMRLVFLLYTLIHACSSWLAPQIMLHTFYRKEESPVCM